MEDISVIVAFGAGLLSFLSPCVLALVPVYLASLYSPEKSRRSRMPLLLHSFSFILGFAVIFIALGALAGLTGWAVRINSSILGKVAGGLLIALGIFMLASFKIPWLNFERHLMPKLNNTSGFLRSFLIGATFSLGWTACVGPILAGILALASVRATALQGAYLLAIYSLGLGIPFLILGTAFDSLSPLLKRIRPYSWVTGIISACLLIFVGVLVYTNSLVRFFSIGSFGF
ncbi:MAG: cytochrome c biogenesis protein CcdA [Dehalococcoidales bacterium]|nr:cytochrome c biogenesis protein CcdA [Dehalococcoidales bacterium]